ncbi:MAG: KOW domain-containing RNA-binding protein, partial [Clostridiales bacterium]|nr:KOW domain-containing RNA-binding protein [Clostridiales bacterium]
GLVVSTAGRAKGYLMAVVRTEGRYVYVCDGRERPLERPKRKNRLHLQPTRYRIDLESVAGNRALRRILQQVQQSDASV